MLDAEAIIGAYLRADPGVQALSARVVPETPTRTGPPWVKVTLIDVRNASRSTQHEHFADYMLQLDCYAGRDGDQGIASRLASAARAALVAMPGGHDGATVTAVEFSGTHRLPDQDFEPAMQRYVLTTSVYMHP